MPVFLEDLEVGQVRTFGARTLTRDEIVAFAREYDPQPFHLDEEAGRASPFGGLVASGWQTCGVMMRMVVDELLGPQSGSLGSPGVDELRWTEPVRPGDTLSVRLEVLEVTPSRTKPDRGAGRFKYEVLNQHGRVVLRCTGVGFFRRRTT